MMGCWLDVSLYPAAWWHLMASGLEGKRTLKPPCVSARARGFLLRTCPIRAAQSATDFGQTSSAFSETQLSQLYNGCRSSTKKCDFFRSLLVMVWHSSKVLLACEGLKSECGCNQLWPWESYLAFWISISVWNAICTAYWMYMYSLLDVEVQMRSEMCW